MPINNYFMQKIDNTSIYIKYQTSRFILIYFLIRNKSKYSSWRAQRVLYVIPTDMFSIHLISARSNDIANISVKSILLQKIAYTSIYDIIMSPEHFEIKNNDMRK